MKSNLVAQSAWSSSSWSCCAVKADRRDASFVAHSWAAVVASTSDERRCAVATACGEVGAVVGRISLFDSLDKPVGWFGEVVRLGGVVSLCRLVFVRDDI